MLLQVQLTDFDKEAQGYVKSSHKDMNKLNKNSIEYRLKHIIFSSLSILLCYEVDKLWLTII